MKKDWKNFLHESVDEFFEVKKSIEYDDLSAWIQKNCESPIEKILASKLSFLTIFGCRVKIFNQTMPSKVIEAVSSQPFTDYRIYLFPQAPIDRYRVDFLLYANFNGNSGHLMVIECDGHDFHERTKEQAIRDRKRDRHLTSKGFKVFRFTGSEIYRSPQKCVDEIVSFLEDVAIQDGDLDHE